MPRYLSKQTITLEQLAALLASEWDAIRNDPSQIDELEDELEAEGVDRVAMKALAKLPATELYVVENEERPMGFVLTGTAIVIGVKVIAAHVPVAKLGEVAATEAIKMALRAIIARIRRRKGVDYLEDRPS